MPAVPVETETGETRLATLFETHHPRLYRLARRLMPSADDARDLVQETYLRVARSPQSVPEGMPAEEAWLVRILVNLCRDGWRRKATRARVNDDDLAAAQVRAPSSQEAAYVARATIWRALRALPPRRRAAIVLHELEGAGIAEIAGLLGVSSVTVRWHLSRGRRDLARVIEKGFR